MNVSALASEIIKGRRLLRGEDFSFFRVCDLQQLCSGADAIREHFVGKHVELCAIINGKSGRCRENCKFCAQSAFNKSGCAVHGFVDEETLFNAAKEFQDEGVHRFSIVTSGFALRGVDFEMALKAYKRMHHELKIELCASMGFLSAEQLERLKSAGVTRYHHNIETSRRNFPNICTSHTYDMKIDTIRLVKEVGLFVCSGGIIGMGETFDDRIDMALSLSELEVDSIPINALMPIQGTALERCKSLSEAEILRTVAMFRYFNPTAQVRLAAGRKLLYNGGEKAFCSGANATITGNMLTTSGTTIQSDKALLLKMGRSIARIPPKNVRSLTAG